jgi:hypothetical protein
VEKLFPLDLVLCCSALDLFLPAFVLDFRFCCRPIIFSSVQFSFLPAELLLPIFQLLITPEAFYSGPRSQVTEHRVTVFPLWIFPRALQGLIFLVAERLGVLLPAFLGSAAGSRPAQT